MEKKDLTDTFNEKREQEKAALETESNLVVASANEKLPPSRQGKRSLTGWFDPKTHQQVRMIAAKEDKTYEQVLGDGLNLLFEKHGMPPIA